MASNKLVASQADKDRVSELNHAIKHNDKLTALSLIEELPQKAFSLKDDDGYTPLHIAAAYSISPDFVEALLPRMSSDQIAAQNNDGETAAHMAAWKVKDPDMLKLIINKMRPEDLAIRTNIGKTVGHDMAERYVQEGLDSRAYRGTLCPRSGCVKIDH